MPALPFELLLINYRDPWVVWFTTGGILWGILGLIIASTKGRSGWGCCLGCLLGPFGLLLTMLMPEDR